MYLYGLGRWDKVAADSRLNLSAKLAGLGGGLTSVASGLDGALKAGNRSSSRDPPPGSGGPEEAAAGPIHEGGTADEGNKGGGGQLKGEWLLIFMDPC